MKKLSLILLTALAALSMNAANIDRDNAQIKASEFLKTHSHGKFMVHGNCELQLVHAQMSSTTDDLANFYVFNTSDGASFVIVAGDDRAQGILAYGEGNLNMSNLPDGMKWILECYDAEMEYLHANPEAEIPHTMTSRDLYVEPMLTCTWSQNEPYWNKCPVMNGSRSATGCGATALSQLMYYWKYPSEAPELPGYVTRAMQYEMPALPSVTLDWDNMLDTYRNVQYTKEQGDAVATLMLYCGQACYMDYSPQASDARNMEYMATALMTFGYKASFLIRDDYETDDWEQIMRQEMEEGRPILYHGMDSNGSGGHVFVLDGYDNGNYHINWGWEGNGDGFFALDEFVVGNYSFTAGQEMTCLIEPTWSTEPITAYDVEVGDIYYRIEDGEAIVVNKDSRFNSYSGDVVIPEQITVGGSTIEVTKIANSAFRNCHDLTSVTIPNSVKVIGNSAFLYCTSLSQVNMSNQVTIIGPNAFANCASLTSITLPPTVTEIQTSAFECCDNLVTVKTSSPSLFLGHFAFMQCYKLRSITFGSGDLNIDKYAFYSCTALPKLTFGDGETHIGEWAFYNCSNLVSVIFGNGPKTIDYAAFAYCDRLSRLNFGTGELSFGSYCFYNTVLTNVNIQDVKSWCEAEFIDNTSNPLAISHQLYINGEAVTDLIAGDDVELVNKYAFNGCSTLKSVTLGKNVKTIDAMAFNGCSAINSVTCLSLTPPDLKKKNSFTTTVYNNGTLYVPARSLEAYQTTAYWSSFANIVGIDTGDVLGDVNGDGAVGIDDVTFLIDMLLTGSAGNNADVNGDGQVGIEDVTALIDMLLCGA